MKNMINQIDLQGYVFSIAGGKLFHNVVDNPSSPVNGVEYITGSINIATDEDGANVVPVRFNFVTRKYGKSGKDNPSWGVLEEIESAKATWEEKGKDEAYKIRLTCSAGSNPFFSNNDGQLIDRPTINVNFAHPANNGFREDSRNSFKFDIVVVNFNIREVEDGDDYGVLNGYVFDSYKKEAIPVSLIVRMPEAIGYFEGLNASTANPVFQTVWGNIVSTTVKHEQITESAFGAPKVTYTTSTQREWVVTGASANPGEFGDESTITEDELIECLNNHEDVVAKAKQRYEDKKNEGNAFSATTTVPKVEKKTFGSPADFKF